MSDDAIKPIQELVETVAKALVDDPDSVRAEPVNSEQGMVLELRVAQDDLGKVIGKQGRTARSIRSLVAAAAERRECAVSFEIVE